MSELKTNVHNVATGEVIERIMTNDEIEMHQKYISVAKLDEEKKKEFEVAKAAAEAKLAALGLDADDLKALGL